MTLVINCDIYPSLFIPFSEATKYIYFFHVKLNIFAYCCYNVFRTTKKDLASTSATEEAGGSSVW